MNTSFKQFQKIYQILYIQITQFLKERTKFYIFKVKNVSNNVYIQHSHFSNNTQNFVYSMYTICIFNIKFFERKYTILYAQQTQI